jgi:membrane protease YdiL (CAAX protease family)
VLLGIPLIIVVAVVGSTIGLAFTGGKVTATVGGSTQTTPVAILACSLLAQQLAQGLWPVLVSKWKGLGPASDWRLRIKPIDLLIGPGTAMMAFGLAALAGGIASTLVHLTDESQADNTKFLRDAQGSPWLYVLLFGAVVGAPLSEELFFRGLILRAFEKRAGRVVAVIGSTAAFTLPHFIGTSLAGTIVLFASIGAVGLVFALVATSVDRLGATIVAHMVFNAFGAAAALGWFDRLQP